jgi:CheY-like chemotaxis protein/anti-sigma regulatory factor (Ser/Thr protein kinase)
VVLKTVLDNIMHSYQDPANEKGLKMSLKMDIGVAESYELDESKITQILGNLISNAIKFTDKGSIQIEVEKSNGDRDTDTLMFKISDTGEGIPETDYDLVFESFSLTKPITTRKQGGTGLGLAIVKRLVELHVSQIKLSSVLGKGSQFYFELKLKKPASNVPVPETPVDRLSGKTALIAEDNEINAMVIRKLLTRWGIATEYALNGKEAVEKANNKAFDFILMDIHMPEMNGFDAAAYIRTHENPNRKTPIFALTADVTASMHVDHVAFFNGFLWKPLQIDKLFEVLSNLHKT